MLLQIDSLRKNSWDKPILNQISFDTESSEIVGVLGESGCGKTTFLKCIAGLLDIDGGEILFRGKPLTPPSEKLIAGHDDIKLVRQDGGLFPNISLRANIEYMLRFYEEAYRKERTEHLLALVGLAEIQNRLPREVSGGEAQRTSIACAIAEKPDLLLLDEPFSHLDHRNKAILKAEIKKIAMVESIACVFVTHDVSDLFELAQKVVVMQMGEIVQKGTPQDIYEKPISQYVAELTGEINLIENQLVRPEKIRIVKQEKADFVAEVTENIFCGNLWKIICNTPQNTIRIWSDEPLRVGEQIYLKIFNKYCP